MRVMHAYERCQGGDMRGVRPAETVVQPPVNVCAHDRSSASAYFRNVLTATLSSLMACVSLPAAPRYGLFDQLGKRGEEKHAREWEGKSECGQWLIAAYAWLDCHGEWHI